jgi:putative cardiolipin synthase
VKVTARSRWVFAFVPLVAAAISACAGLPPAADYPKHDSVRLARVADTPLGRRIAAASLDHDGKSGFRILSAGADGLLARFQMIDAAERTLDLQYFIFRGDTTGRLLAGALKRAADRGVRVRILVDDGNTIAGDQQVLALDGHANLEVRIFNPFAYRGHSNVVRAIEFLLNARRLNYRMHNKLMVMDNAVALIGGRNIGDAYFQVDPQLQYADEDMFATGPVVDQLSASFDEFWRSRLTIPAAAFRPTRPQPLKQQAALDMVAERTTTGEPYAGLISGRPPVVWANAQVVSDSPDKRQVVSGARAGRLMSPTVLHTVQGAHTELLMITPYFIPTAADMALLRELRERNVHVAILTNSLEGAPGAFAESGYLRFQVPLVKAGVDLYEARSLLGSARGSGQTARISRHGHYALHAKLFVVDRRQLFVGSMNFDRRSKMLNTEVGLIIDSPALAQETVTRFDAMVQPQNAYNLTLRSDGDGRSARLNWHTEEEGKPVDYSREPAHGFWQRLMVRALSLLPLGSQQ